MVTEAPSAPWANRPISGPATLLVPVSFGYLESMIGFEGFIYIYIYHQTWMNFTNNHQQHGSYMIPIRVGVKLMGISLQCGMGPFMFETIVFAKYMCFLQIFASAKSGIGLHHGKCRCLLRSSCYPHWGCWSQRCRTACGLLRNRGSGMSRTLISYTANTPRWTQHKPTEICSLFYKWFLSGNRGAIQTRKIV